MNIKRTSSTRLAVLLWAFLLAGCATTAVAPPASRDEPSVTSIARATPPGALNDDVTQANVQQTICVPGWTSTVRPSTSYTNGVKAKLLREQGLPQSDATKYELDHFVPLALGGHPRKIDNMWLQLWVGEWGARTKDRLEVRLKNLVCSGAISLQRARDAIRRDWIAAFKTYVGSERGSMESIEVSD
jgi:hypothetical protein